MTLDNMKIFGALGRFLRCPWSACRAVAVGLAMGALGALLQAILFRVGPFEFTYVAYVAPAVFWTAAGVVIWLLYRQVEKAQFRSDARAAVRGLLALGLFAVGVAGVAWCYRHHVCMEGHMAHPPYPAWHYGLDAGWVACLVTAVFWLCRIRSVLGPGLATFAAFLVCFRFLFGSAGGMYSVVPF
jgi:hypothetical protein